MTNCIIVDDEPLARAVITSHLSKVESWNVVKECINAIEAYEALHSYPVQVMFLDIHMPLITGTEFLRSLKKPPLVVFTTAYSNYAVEGFELTAVDYLLKPITFERFSQAIIKVQERLNLPEAEVREKEMKLIEPSTTDHIFIKHDNKLVKLKFEDILFLEAQRDFTRIYLKEKTFLASFHLKMLEEMLPRNKFLRVHRSYLVSLNAISAIQGNVLEIGTHKIPVGGNFKDALTASLKLG